MAKEYVESRDGHLWVIGSRVSLDSLVYGFLRGESPEGIVESYPAVNLEQVFGAIAFYLANREAVDEYLRKSAAEFADFREEAHRRDPAFYAKLEAARRPAA